MPDRRRPDRVRPRQLHVSGPAGCRGGNSSGPHQRRLDRRDRRRHSPGQHPLGHGQRRLSAVFGQRERDRSRLHQPRFQRRHQRRCRHQRQYRHGRQLVPQLRLRPGRCRQGPLTGGRDNYLCPDPGIDLAAAGQSRRRRHQQLKQPDLLARRLQQGNLERLDKTAELQLGWLHQSRNRRRRLQLRLLQAEPEPELLRQHRPRRRRPDLHPRPGGLRGRDPAAAARAELEDRAVRQRRRRRDEPVDPRRRLVDSMDPGRVQLEHRHLLQPGLHLLRAADDPEDAQQQRDLRRSRG